MKGKGTFPVGFVVFTGVGDLREGGGGVPSSNSPSSGDDVACRLYGRESSRDDAPRLTGVDSM